MTSDATSWGSVANWYDEYLKDDDTYQAKVIWPNLKRIVNPAKGQQIVDLACGQGYFSALCAEQGASVIGLDIAAPLIEIARQKAADKSWDITFGVAPAHNLGILQNKTKDATICILALQNIKELDQAIAEVSRVLKIGGRFIFVINHPSFRVPKYSDWHFDEKSKIQKREVWKYMQEATISIDMNPGTKAASKKMNTVSFHRPLQLFSKLLQKHGFYIARIEEWCSHKKTEAGPRKATEDESRKEIPMFMCIEAHLLKA